MKKGERLDCRLIITGPYKAAAWAIAEGYRRGFIRGVDLVPEFLKLLRQARELERKKQRDV